MARMKLWRVLGWRSEPVVDAIAWDELWKVVKCQSNLEIAGSPRNACWCSVGCFVAEVQHWMGQEIAQKVVSEPNQTLNAVTLSLAVRLWRISPMVERGTAQTAC